MQKSNKPEDLPEAEFDYDFIEGVLVMGASDVVRSACDIQPGGRVWGNSLHQAIISLPGAVKARKGWMAPAREMAGLIASRDDLPKSEETVRALVHAIIMEETEGSEVWHKAQKAKEEQLRNKEREERKARMMDLLDSVDIRLPEEEA